MTFATSLLPIVDAFLALIDVPEGWTKDSAGRKPYRYAPNTLYGYPVSQAFKRTGDGIRADFKVQLAIAAASDEDAKLVGRRDVSDALDGMVQVIADAVHANPTADDFWDDLELDAVAYDATQGTRARVDFADISGYRTID